MRGRMGLGLGGLVLAAALGMGVGVAQKPPPAGQDPAPPAGKPGTAPPRTAPPRTEAPRTDAPRADAPRADAPAAPPAAPPAGTLLDEATAIARLRTLLGTELRLTYGAAEVTDALRGNVRLARVVLTPQGPAPKPITIEQLDLDDLHEDGLGEAIARNLSVGAGAEGATLANLRVTGLLLRRPAAGEAPRPDNLSLDSARLRGLEVRTAAGPTVKLAELSLEDFGTGRNSRLALGGLDVQGVAGQMADRVQLDRAVLRGFDMAKLLGAFAAGASPASNYGRSAMEVEGLVASAAGQPIFGLGSLQMLSNQPRDGVGTGRLVLRSIAFNLGTNAPEPMRRLGLTQLLFDLGMDASWDPTTGRAEAPNITLAGRELGTLALAASFDGALVAALERQGTDAMRLVSLSLRYLDQSLAQRLLAAQAREQNTTEAQLREQYATMLGGALAAPPLVPLRNALQRFIRGQAREVEITLRPPQPLALGALRSLPPNDPAAAAQTLGLGASAR